MLKSLPVVPTAPHISVTVPPASVTVKVIVSVVSSVVIPEPAKVTVSLLESATISFCPETATNIHWSEPLSVFVTVMSPFVVIGLPETLNPPPLVKPTLVTVPPSSF